jgi:catechol 2,3-dioxygenase-like lactoylglutathione lyase family enzyme
MITRFDHAVIAARDLDEARRAYTEMLGFQVYPGGRHTGLGTQNAIVRFGLDYLELMGIYDASEVAASGTMRALLLDFLAEHEGGMLGYCLATDDIDGLAARFRATGLDARGPFAMERQRPDGVTLRWRLLVPGGTAWRRPWPFFIQWEMDDTARLSLERPGDHPLGVKGVAGVSVVVRDLEAARYLYATQLGLEQTGASAEDESCITFGVGETTIDLVAPRSHSADQTFLETYGEGLYRVFLRIESMAQAHALLAEHDVGLTDEGTPAAPWAIPSDVALGAHLVLVGG